MSAEQTPSSLPKAGTPSDREPEHVTISTRDPKESGERLQRWLADKLGPGATRRSPDVTSPESTGCPRRPSCSLPSGWRRERR